jgi:ATP-dependent RNA helicase RhlE
MAFQLLGLSAALATIVKSKGYSKPSSIQEQAIPIVLSGKDMLGLAQTGTGKTAAFALPIIQRLAGEKPKSAAPRTLVVAPTRELAQQLLESFRTYSEGLNLKVCAIYGGAPMDRQIRQIKKGIDIVIGCPGRLLDLANRRVLNFKELQVLVLDEADQMFDMGFLPDIKKLLALMPSQRQTLLFSATMPEEISSLANSILKDPQTIRIARKSIAETINHSVFEVRADQKPKALLELLKQQSIHSAIIFVRTKRRVESVSDALENAGHSVSCLSGNLSQNRRNMSIKGFKSGEYNFLVATDVASRGLDISNLGHVINYDIPQTVESYTHRVGRTGRAENSGEAITLVSREDMRILRQVEKVLGKPIDRLSIPGFEAETHPEPRASHSRERRPSTRPSFSGERSSSRSGPRTNSSPRFGESKERGSDRGERREFRPSRAGTHDRSERSPSAPRAARDDFRSRDNRPQRSRDERPSRTAEGRDSSERTFRDRAPAARRPFRDSRPSSEGRASEGRDERPRGRSYSNERSSPKEHFSKRPAGRSESSSDSSTSGRRRPSSFERTARPERSGRSDRSENSRNDSRARPERSQSRERSNSRGESSGFSRGGPARGGPRRPQSSRPTTR